MARVAVLVAVSCAVGACQQQQVKVPAFPVNGGMPVERGRDVYLEWLARDSKK